MKVQSHGNMFQPIPLLIFLIVQEEIGIDYLLGCLETDLQAIGIIMF